MSTPDIHPALKDRAAELERVRAAGPPQSNHVQLHRVICRGCAFDTGWRTGRTAENQGEAHAATHPGHELDLGTWVHVRTIKRRPSILDERA